ncbi:MAG: CHAT domain-containing protein [Acidobacteriaceae bacterium]
MASDGAQKYRDDHPDWAARFKVLQAEVLTWQGKFRGVLSLLESPLPSSAPDDAVIRRRIIQAIAHYRLGELDQSAADLTEAEQLARAKQQDLLPDVVMARASLMLNRGDYAKAEGLYIAALGMARQQKRLFLETSVIGNLGVLALKRKRCGEAIDWFTSAQANAQQLQNQLIASRILGNLGWCYYTLGEFDRALDNYTEAEAASIKIGAVQDQLIWLNNIGLIYDAQRDYNRAQQYYEQSLKIARDLQDNSQAVIALNNLALAALKMGELEEADTYNQEAMRLEKELSDKTWDLYSVLNAGSIAAGRGQNNAALKLFRDVIQGAGDDLSLRWEAESHLAALYASENRDVTADLQYKKGLETIDKARNALSEDHRLSFLNTATEFYNDYIDFLIAHHREREALAVAEHSRARTLAEGLKLPVGQVGEPFHPEQNARRLNSVILSYWLKPGQSYLWVVTPSKVQLFTLPGRDQIDAAVEDYRKGLLGPRGLRDPADAEKLYNMLVAPAEKLIRAAGKDPRLLKAADVGHGKTPPRVIVIADGSLLSLNFETLMAPTPEPHYWIEDAIVSNAASIALLRAENRAIVSSGHRTLKKNGSTARSRGGSILLIGDPNYAGTDFPQLSQAKLEVEKVESYFPAPERTVIEDKAAVPAAYDQAKPGQFSYIHFVAHGTASRVSPLDSSIVLSKQGDAYKLYARDIMQQPLKADLVTVSACYGAGNRAYSGEGLVGLSWAFLRAGAHNVIAALWEVNDASTPQLMDNLYRNINNGEDPASALRHAKLDLLHSDNVYRRPFYWGAFQLYVGS